jgi:hypothetical protein
MVRALTCKPAIQHISLKLISIRVRDSALTRHLILYEASQIYRSAFVLVKTLSMHHSSPHFSLVIISVLEVDSSSAL